MARLHYASTKDADMFYLVGKRVADPFFYIETGGKKEVILNNLEIGAFREQGKKGIVAVPFEPLAAEARLKESDEPMSHKLALMLLDERGLLGKPIAVSKHLPLDMVDYLRARGAKLLVEDPFVPERTRKSAEEVLHIRGSVQKTTEAFKKIESILAASVIEGDSLSYVGAPLTSEFLKKEVERVFVEVGLENSEGIIISSGPQAAMPHHEGNGIIRPNTTIVCDIFPCSKETGYFADVTRTYLKGTPSSQQLKMYEAVKAAQDAAFLMLRPGVPLEAAYRSATNIIEAAGFHAGEQGFIHGLGHGVGLEVHEPPRLSRGVQGVLEVGNVVTVEPGLYYPEHGGVRLEDVVVITENGYENLTNYPRTFVIP